MNGLEKVVIMIIGLAILADVIGSATTIPAINAASKAFSGTLSSTLGH